MLAKLRRSLLLSPGHNLQISAIFLFSLLLPHLTSGKRISKVSQLRQTGHSKAINYFLVMLQCCPLGQLLSPSGRCTPMMSGTALPKIRVKGNLDWIGFIFKAEVKTSNHIRVFTQLGLSR